jgi:hypothetical protein
MVVDMADALPGSRVIGQVRGAGGQIRVIRAADGAYAGMTPRGLCPRRDVLRGLLHRSALFCVLAAVEALGLASRSASSPHMTDHQRALSPSGELRGQAAANRRA